MRKLMVSEPGISNVQLRDLAITLEAVKQTLASGVQEGSIIFRDPKDRDVCLQDVTRVSSALFNLQQ